MKTYFKGDMVSYETYKPNARQQLFHQVRRWENFSKLVKGAIGGIGGGKSVACMQELAEVCLRTPGGLSLAMRASMPKADLTLTDEIGSFICGDRPVAEWVSKKESYYFQNDHRLAVVPGDKWDRFGSTQLVGAYVQEAQELDYRVFSVLSERLRHPAGTQEGIPYYRLLFDSRPIESKHWIKERFMDLAWKIDEGPDARLRAKNPHWAYTQFSSFDNKENLPTRYIEDAIHEHQHEPGWIKMMIYGEVGYSLDGQPVYGDSYNPEIHDATIEEDPRLPILRGWDFGYRSPAVLWCQWTRDGRLLVLRELTPKKCARDRLVDEVLATQEVEFPGRHPSQYRDFGDIAGQQIDSTGITDMEYVSERLGTTFEGLQKARIENGLDVVRGLMRKPRPYAGRVLTCFLVDERCSVLREALRGMYFYPDKGEHREPHKGNGYDDVCDALRFVAQSVAPDGDTRDPYTYGAPEAGDVFASYGYPE